MSRYASRMAAAVPSNDVDALKAMAESGKNNTVVYIPTGANGIPLIANANPSQVTAP